MTGSHCSWSKLISHSGQGLVSGKINVLKLFNNAIKHLKWGCKVRCREKMDVVFMMNETPREPGSSKQKGIVLIPFLGQVA